MAYEALLQRISDRTEWKGEHLLTKYAYPRIVIGEDTIYVHQALFIAYNNLDEMPQNICLHRQCTEKLCVLPLHYKQVPRLKRKREEYEPIIFSEIDDLTRQYHLTRLLKNTSSQNNTGCLNSTCGVGKDGKSRTEFQAKSFVTHRLVYQLYHRKNVDDALHIRHLCGNARCCNIDHLAEGTAVQNAQDKIQHGTYYERVAKISADVALQIWKLKGHKTAMERAKMFDTTVSTVKHIDGGHSWNHVTGQPKVRFRRKKKRFETKTDFQQAQAYVEKKASKTIDGHWLWIEKDVRSGYGHCHGMPAHRFSYIVFNNISNLEKKIFVRHKCKEKLCVNPDHLELGNALSNARDKFRDETMYSGEKHYRAKITKEVAAEIRKSKGQGTRVERSKRFGVSVSIIEKIDSNKSWKDI